MEKKEREISITTKNLDDYETSFMKKMQTKIEDRLGIKVELK